MSMQKTMILHVCLGILLLGIVITPSVFAGDGCGTGTVLVDGVCQLAPQESNDGCGAGTVMVNGVCQLDKSSGGSIQLGYIAAGAAAIGAAIIGIIFVVRRGSGGHQHQNLPDKIWMIMRNNTYGDKVKDLPASQQRQDRHLRLVTVVENH